MLWGTLCGFAAWRETILAASEFGFNYAFQKRRCEQAARDTLATELRTTFDTGVVPGGLWYCPGLEAALYDFMDWHAAEESRAIVQTEAARVIGEQLRFVVGEKVVVPFVGETRTGKTTPAAAFASAWPGRARIVTLTGSDRWWNFFTAIADALGISYTNRTSLQALKRDVEFVCHWGRMPLLIDEAHFWCP